MRSQRLAEMFLLAVMAPDRAAAAVGDLLEHGLRGVEFWTAIARTLGRSALQQLSVKTAVEAWLWTLACTALGRVAFATALMIGARIVPSQMSTWMETVLGIEFVLFAPAVIGRIVAAKMPGREAALWLTQAVLVVPITALWLAQPEAMATRVVSAFFLSAPGVITMLPGVLLGRRANLRAA